MTAYRAWSNGHIFVEYKGLLGKIRQCGVKAHLLFTSIGGWRKEHAFRFLIPMDTKVCARNLK